MREIKFRAWDKKNKIMITPTVYFDGDGLWTSYDIPLDSPPKKLRIELMQYTGLKDKTGKEIYEGDIVTYSTAWKRMMEEAGSKHSGKKGKEIIVWNEFGFMTQQPEFFDTNVGGRYLWLLKNDKDLEVIGNIYSNKDLL